MPVQPAARRTMDTLDLLLSDLNLFIICIAVAALTSQLRAIYEREHGTARIDHLTRVLNRKGIRRTS